MSENGKLNIEYVIVTLFLAFVYSTCFVFGRNIEEFDAGLYSDVHTYIHILIATVIIKLIIDGVVFGLGKIRKISELNLTKKISDKGLFFIGWIVMLVCYFPTWLACFPGLELYDGPAQVASWSRIHPILHNAFVHLCVFISKNTLVTDWVLVYSVIQLILYTLTFSLIFMKMRKLGVADIYLVAAYIGSILFPLNGLMAITTTKDALFALIFTLWILELIELLKEGEKYFENRRNVCRLIVISVIMCTFRNNGIYVFVATGVIFIIFLKKARKKLLIFVISFSVVYSLLTGPVLTMAGLPKGEPKEALSIIIQPLARVYRYAGYELSEEDKSKIVKLFGGNEPWYLSHIADPPKSQFDYEEFSSNKTEYLNLYIKEGLRYPWVYLDAVLGTTYGNWYPLDTLPDTTCFRVYFEFPEKTPEEYGSPLGGYYTFLQNFSYNSSYNKILPLRVMMSTGTAFWIMLAFGAYGIVRHRKGIILCVVPSIMLWGTIMLGPVALFRYTYPLMVANMAIGGVVFTDFFSALKHRE